MGSKQISIEEVRDLAVDCLLKRGSHHPQFLIPQGDKLGIVVCPFEDDEDKERVKRQMREFIHKARPDFYFFISEGWMVKHKKKGEILKGRPSEHPDRVECLVIQKFSRDMKNEGILIEFKRDEDDKPVIVEESKEHDKVSSVFNFFMEDGGHEEYMDHLHKRKKGD